MIRQATPTPMFRTAFVVCVVLLAAVIGFVLYVTVALLPDWMEHELNDRAVKRDKIQCEALKGQHDTAAERARRLLEDDARLAGHPFTCTPSGVAPPPKKTGTTTSPSPNPQLTNGPASRPDTRESTPPTAQPGQTITVRPPTRPPTTRPTLPPIVIPTPSPSCRVSVPETLLTKGQCLIP